MTDISGLMHKILKMGRIFSVQVVAFEPVIGFYTATVVLKTSKAGQGMITCVGETAEEALEKMIEKLNDNRNE